MGPGHRPSDNTLLQILKFHHLHLVPLFFPAFRYFRYSPCSSRSGSLLLFWAQFTARCFPPTPVPQDRSYWRHISTAYPEQPPWSPLQLWECFCWFWRLSWHMQVRLGGAQLQGLPLPQLRTCLLCWASRSVQMVGGSSWWLFLTALPEQCVGRADSSSTGSRRNQGLFQTTVHQEPREVEQTKERISLKTLPRLSAGALGGRG